MAGTQILPRTFPTPVIGLASIQACPSNPARVSLTVYNPNATATLAICALDTMAAIGGAGTITLPPGQGVELDGWTAGINAIASLATQQITILEFS
jgi:hypothetical protein